MDQHSKSELIKTYRKQYKRAKKGEKTRIVNTIIEATGYSREATKHLMVTFSREATRNMRVKNIRVIEEA